MNMINKKQHITVFALASFPIFVFIGFLAYVIQARFHFGFWPSYGNPDPRDMGLWVQHNLLTISLMAVIFTPLVVSLLAFYERRRSQNFPVIAAITFSIITTVALIIVAQADLGGFTSWFFD